MNKQHEKLILQAGGSVNLFSFLYLFHFLILFLTGIAFYYFNSYTFYSKSQDSYVTKAAFLGFTDFWSHGEC